MLWPLKVNTITLHDSVHAKCVSCLTASDKSVSREFSRQIDLPQSVDSSRLKSTLSQNGLLTVEAPVTDSSFSSSSSLNSPTSPNGHPMSPAYRRLVSHSPSPSSAVTPTTTIDRQVHRNRTATVIVSGWDGRVGGRKCFRASLITPKR